MPKASNVFISHVHEDDEKVGAMKDLLKNNGYSVRDSSVVSSTPNKAKSEAYIKSQILAPKIRWAGAMVVLISPKTHTSKWVNWEIEHAQRTGTRVVGVWAQGAKESDVPEALNKYADAVVGWNGKAINDAITGRTNNWVQSDGSIRPPRPIPRYSCATAA